MSIEPTPYFAIDFDVNNQPSFRMDPTLTVQHNDIIDIGSLKLNAINFGDFDRIPIITTLSANNQKCRWIKIGGKWYRLCTPTFALIYNQQWQANLYDGEGNPAIETTIDPNSKAYESIEAIDNISILEAFGSHYKIVKIGPRWYVIKLPH